jgi:hypothetical protein
MKGRFKKINVILVLTISFSIPLFSTYLQYRHLSGIVFRSTYMSFEDVYDEDLSTLKNEFNTLVHIASCTKFFQSHNFIEQCYLFSSQITSHSQNKSILRC